jgi:hypothetical protein
LAVNDLGYSAAEVAHALDLRRVSAGQCVTRGEKLLDENFDLRDKLTNLPSSPVEVRMPCKKL